MLLPSEREEALRGEPADARVLRAKLLGYPSALLVRAPGRTPVLTVVADRVVLNRYRGTDAREEFSRLPGVEVNPDTGRPS